MHPLRALSTTLPLVLTTLSMAFIITSFTSNHWAKLDFFAPNLQIIEWDPSDPLYTLYRGPFTTCSAREIPGTEEDGSDSTFEVTCNRHRANGAGKTSCELPSTTGQTSGPTNGDARMCQQIHLSANLLLAALVFVCVSFVLCAVLSTLVFVSSGGGGQARKGNAGSEESAASSKRYARRGPLLTTLRNFYIFAAAIAAIATFLSQHFAILGLIQSQPDNGLYASFVNGGSVLDGDLSHAPWVQDTALNVYATLGWMFAALGAGGAAGWYRF